MMQTQLSEYETASQANLKPKNYLLGTIMKLCTNATYTILTIYLKEEITAKEEEEEEEEEEEKEEQIPYHSNSSQPFSINGSQKRKHPDHSNEEEEQNCLIKLYGTWCQLLAEDLKVTLNLKIYFDCYKPELDLKKKCWEFREGLRADLYIYNPFKNYYQQDPTEPKIFRKRIDLGPIDLNSLDESRRDETLDEEEYNLINLYQNIHQQDTCSRMEFSNGNTIKHEIKQEESLKQSPIANKADLQNANSHKRICTDIDSNTVVESSTATNLSNQKLHTVNPEPLTNQRVHSNLNPTVISASILTSTLNNYCDDQSNKIGVNTPGSSEPKKFQGWKTLAEIDRMDGGPSDKFHVIGIIRSKQTEKSMPSHGGTQDYRMTLYLSDFSRPKGYKDVTCNLFSKSESTSPPWLNADWKIIMLFNVFKRKSQIFSTQIVAPARSTDWAIWCPAYLGSAERLEASFSKESNQIVNDSCHKYHVTDLDLKNFARELHQLDQNQLNSLTQSLSFAQCDSFSPIESIQKNLSELRPGMRHPVDLCVKIVDVWTESAGNDRLTVCDFTSNPLLKFTKPRSLNPILQFHIDNGGNETNWKMTSNRLLTLYVAKPYLKLIYDKLEENKVDSNQTFNIYEIKSSLINNYFKFTHVELRAGGGSAKSGVFYGLLENPFRSKFERDSSSDGDPYLDNLDDQSCEILASKIVPLKPSNPAYRQMLRAEESYQQEMQEST